jgi:hypothetical protein
MALDRRMAFSSILDNIVSWSFCLYVDGQVAETFGIEQ